LRNGKRGQGSNGCKTRERERILIISISSRSDKDQILCEKLMDVIIKLINSMNLSPP
jgi:hypothetical protein